MSTSFYDVSIWEEIRSMVCWKTDRLVESIHKEIPKDPSLAEFQGKQPVSIQLREIMEQRANAWVQRLYDLCCDAYKSRGKTLSADFHRAILFYRIGPFILGETNSQIHDHTMDGFLNLLLCAVGSPPERRRSLTVSQRQCCLDVRLKVYETWQHKLRHLPPRANEAIEAMASFNARQRRAVCIVAGLPPDDPSPPPATPAHSLAQPQESLPPRASNSDPKIPPLMIETPIDVFPTPSYRTDPEVDSSKPSEIECGKGNPTIEGDYVKRTEDGHRLRGEGRATKEEAGLIAHPVPILPAVLPRAPVRPLSRPPTDDQSRPSKPSDGVFTPDTRREAVIKKVRNPQANTIVTVPEAAHYFEITAHTIYVWVSEGKLKSGPKRGSITIESIREWEKKRSRKRRAL